MYGPGALLANRYRLEERVGGGGMGEVWRATDEVLGRIVAVKVMRPELLEEPGFADRFLAEARTMATIKHRGVVAVHDYQGDAASAFLVMEYVEGESLSRRLHRFGRLDPVRTMTLIAQAAEALQAAHDKGVVHRDIKPGNLLVTADDTLVLTDFGIARSAASTPLTATGAVIGTPSYLAPEQVLGKPATPQSDVYALGVVAYECLNGRRPFDGDNPFDVAMKRLREPPPTMTDGVPTAVLGVVERTLAADPDQRWPSAAALAAAARKAVIQPAAAPTSPIPTSPAAPTSPVSPASPAAAASPASPAAAAGSVAPDFVTGRVPVREPRPVAPTRLDTPSPTPPPASPRPSPTPPPPYPPAPARPGPPVTLTMACVLLCVAALALSVYCLATVAIIDDVDRIAAGEYGSAYERDWRGAIVGAGWLTAGSVALLVLLLLLLAVLNVRGSRAARAWTIVLGVSAVCCCVPTSWPLSIDRLAENGETANLAQRLSAELGWYGPLAGRSILIAAVALLVAMVLLMVPPTNRYFRLFRPTPRPAYYHPYPYYPYPPRR